MQNLKLKMLLDFVFDFGDFTFCEVLVSTRTAAIRVLHCVVFLS